MAFLDDDEDIEHIVGKWAEALGLGTTLPRNAVAALEAMKFGKFIRDYAIVPDREMLGAKGQFESASQKIILRQSTYDAAVRKEPWALWVVFEEIAHAALRHSGTRNFSGTKNATERFSSVAKRQEAEARRFAATIMAPFNLIGFTEGTTVEDLQRHARLPKQAADYRLIELGRIFRRRTRKPRELPAAVLDFLRKEPARHHAFEGDPCPNPHCGKLQMVRDGLGTRCLACGTRTGRD